MLAALIAWAASLAPVTAFTAADVARCESSARYDDGAAVLATAAARARVLRRPLLAVLRQPWQFARGCPSVPRLWSWQHVRLGIELTTGTLRAPAWTRHAFQYCGPGDSPRCVATRGPIVGRIVHTFHRR